MYDHVLREEVPVPSWADVGYLSSLLFLSWTFVLGPLWQSTDLTTAGGLVALGYPFGDVVVRQALLVIDLIAPREGRRGSLGERLQSALVGAVPEAAVESSPSRSPEQVKP